MGAFAEGRHQAVVVAGADGHFGWLAPCITLGVPASSTLTRRQLGWHPVQPALIPDLDKGPYFNG